ncbi:uncharacterized protein [Mytilus edulis]|uniref:uncharacterized protein n=1 Tax=Mytilus edulis TaxID=6550 RepID=UPI0039EF73AB
MESTIDKVQHTTKTKDSSYTSIALIISGIAASFTLITAFIVLRKFKDTTSRIKHSDLTDTEHNSIINDGIDFIKTINYNGQMDKKYYNIPPKSHMNTLYNSIDVSKKLNCNKQLDKEGYNNIPPECHMNIVNDDIDEIKTLKCN